MPEKESRWDWTQQRELAAKLVAEDELPDRRIAEECGVAEHTIYLWRRREEFIDRVDSLVREYRARIRRSGIAVLENRIRKLAKIQGYMDDLMEQRLKDCGSPIIVRQIKGIGSGEGFREISEFPTDVGLLREYREYMKQASQELGQWAEAGNEGQAQALSFLKVLDQQMKAGPAKVEEPEEQQAEEPKE